MPKQPPPPPPPSASDAAPRQVRFSTPQPTSTAAHRPQEQPQRYKDRHREDEDDDDTVADRDQSRGSMTSPVATAKKKRQTLSDFRIPVSFGARKPKARAAEPAATSHLPTFQDQQQEQQQRRERRGHERHETEAQHPNPQQGQQQEQQQGQQGQQGQRRQEDNLHQQRQQMHKQLEQHVGRRSRSRGLDSPRAPSDDLRAVGRVSASPGRRRKSASPPASPRVMPRRVPLADDNDLLRSHSHIDLDAEQHRRLKEMPHKISQMMRRGMKRLDGRDAGRGFFNRFKRKTDKDGGPGSASDSEGDVADDDYDDGGGDSDGDHYGEDAEGPGRRVRLSAERPGGAGRYDNEVDAVVIDRSLHDSDVPQHSRQIHAVPRFHTDISVSEYEDGEDPQPVSSSGKSMTAPNKKQRARRSFMSFGQGRKKELAQAGLESDSEDSGEDAGDSPEYKHQDVKQRRRGQGKNALLRLSGVREGPQASKDTRDDDEEKGRDRSEGANRGHGVRRRKAPDNAAVEEEVEDEDNDGLSEDGDEDEDDYDDEDLEDPDQTDNIELRKLAAEANRIRQEKEEKEEKMSKLDRALENISASKTDKSSKEVNKLKKQRERYKKQISEFDSRLKDIKEEKKKVATGVRKPFFDRAAERLQQGVSRFITRTLHESNSDHGSHDAPKLSLTSASDSGQQPPPPGDTNAEGGDRQQARSEKIGDEDAVGAEDGEHGAEQPRPRAAEAATLTSAEQRQRATPYRQHSISPSLGKAPSSAPQSPATFRRTATATSPGRPRTSMDAGHTRHRHSAAISTPSRSDAGGGLRGRRVAAGISMPPDTAAPRRGTSATASDGDWDASQTELGTRIRARSTTTSNLAAGAPSTGASLGAKPQRSRPHSMALAGGSNETVQGYASASSLSASANAGTAGPRSPRKPQRTISGPAKTGETAEQQQHRLKERRRRTEEAVDRLGDVLVEEDDKEEPAAQHDLHTRDEHDTKGRAGSAEQARRSRGRRVGEGDGGRGGRGAVRIRPEADDIVETDDNRSDELAAAAAASAAAGGGSGGAGRGRGDGRGDLRQSRQRQVSQDSRSVSSERTRGPAMSPSPSPNWGDDKPAGKRRSQTHSQDRSGHLAPPSTHVRPRSTQGQAVSDARDDRSRHKRFGSWAKDSDPADADFEVRHGKQEAQEDKVPPRRRHGASRQSRPTSDASVLLEENAPRLSKRGDVRSLEAAYASSESEQSFRSTPGRRGERGKMPAAPDRKQRPGLKPAGDGGGEEHEEEPYDSDTSSRSRGKEQRGKRGAGGNGVWKEPRAASEPGVDDEMLTPSTKRKDKKRSKFDPRRFLPNNAPKHGGEEKKKRFGRPTLRQPPSSGRKGADKVPFLPSDRASPTSSLSSDRDLALQGVVSPAHPIDELNRWKNECVHLENENAQLEHHAHQLRLRLSRAVKMHDDRYLAWERRLEQERQQLAELVRDYHEMLSGKLHDNARGIARLQQSIATVEDSSASFMRDLRSTQRSVKEYLDHMKRVDEPVAAAADQLAPQVVTLLAIWDSYKGSLAMAAGAVALVLALWLFVAFVLGLFRSA